MKARGYTPCLDDPKDPKCKYITTAAGMSPVLNNEEAPLKEWVEQMDFVNLMTYDYHGAWQNVSAHQTPMGRVKLPEGIPDDFNIEETVEILIKKGVPPKKMTLGLAAYGRGWGDTTAEDYNQFGPCTSTCALKPGTWEGGVYSYWDLAANYIPTWTKYDDSIAKAPYIASDQVKGLIVYDDPESIQVKVDFAKSLGFGGFMWWEASDDPEFVLATAAIDAWNGKLYPSTLKRYECYTTANATQH
jgi:chitinase